MTALYHNHRRAVLVATAAVILAAALAAAGWAWFSSGSGQASAPIAVATSTTSPLTLSATTSQSGPLVPGGAAATVNVSISNPTSSSVHVGSISAAITAGLPVGCLAAWFDVTIPAQPGASSLAPGGSTTAQARVAFLDLTATDQTACSGATPTLTVTL